MKQLTNLMLVAVMLFSQGCQPIESKHTQSNNIVDVKNEVKENPNKMIFENLDLILSPFEDMTEFALEKNDEGIAKSLEKIETAIKEDFFTKNLNPESSKLLSPKIETLKELIKEKNYEKIALVSTDIFEYNTSNFIDTKKIENQIRIEHLDYMGFKILALLNQKKVDWQNILGVISSVHKEWLALSPNVKDNNLKDSFEYLFEGLRISAANKDVNMSKTLSSMDLSLVDVLESSF